MGEKTVFGTTVSDSCSPSGVIDPEGGNTKSIYDEAKLGDLGYKQELARAYSRWEVFGVAFSIMSLAPAIASVLIDSLIAGPNGLTVGWLVAMFFVMQVALQMGELSSSMPVAHSMAYWTHKLSPARYRKFLSYFSGWSDLIGLWAGCASVFYGFTLQLLSSVQLGEPQYVSTNAQNYGVFVAAHLLSLCICYVPSYIMSKIQMLTIYLNAIAAIVLVIALPVGLKHKGIDLNSGSDVFGKTDNITNYPSGWPFLLCWMSAIWTCSTLDTSTHMAEETKDAERAIPFSIILSSALCYAGGFVIVCVLAAVIDWSDLDPLMNSELPLALIIARCLNEKWAMGIMGYFSAIQFFMGISTMYANSRQCFALARDRALPVSHILRKVDNRGVPFVAMCCTCLVSLLLGLLILAGHTAASALFSCSVTSLYMSWSIPIWLKFFLNPDTFVPGPFYMGKLASRITGGIASIFCVFVIFVLTLLPADIPVTDPASMNWTVLVTAGFWILSIIWYFVKARNVYEGPVTTYDGGDGVLESQELETRTSSSKKD